MQYLSAETIPAGTCYGDSTVTHTTGRFVRLLSYCGLALSIVPALLVFEGTIAKDLYLNLMVGGMLLWFCTAVLWIRPDHLGE